MKLIFHFEGNKTEEFILSKNKVLIGRGSDCDVILHQDGFSRHHAMIELENGGFFVTDINSTNGVFIDGRRIPSSSKTLLNTFLNLQMASAIQIECIDDNSFDSESSSSLGNFNFSAKSSTDKVKEDRTNTDLMEPRPRVKIPTRQKPKTEKNKSQRTFFLLVPVLVVIFFFVFHENEDNVQNTSVNTQVGEVQTNQAVVSEFVAISSYPSFFQNKSCVGDKASWCEAGRLAEAQFEGAFPDGKNLVVFMNITSDLAQPYSDKFLNLSELTKIELLMLRRLFVSQLVRNFLRQNQFDSLQSVGLIQIGQEPKLKVVIKISRNLDDNKYDKFTVNGLLDQIINQGNGEGMSTISAIYESKSLE